MAFWPIGLGQKIVEEQNARGAEVVTTLLVGAGVSPPYAEHGPSANPGRDVLSDTAAPATSAPASHGLATG